MAKQKKNKKQILQHIRMLAAMHVRLRHTTRGSKNPKLKANRRKDNISNTPKTPRKFRRMSIYNADHASNKNDIKKRELIKKYLPTNLKYITTHKNSPFNLNEIRNARHKHICNGQIIIPERFSILDNTEQSVDVFHKMLSALFIENGSIVKFDYGSCKSIDLSTQVLFDIILKEYIKFVKLEVNKSNLFFKKFYAVNINDESVAKLMWSVGSPANFGKLQVNFPDVEKFKLRIYDNAREKDESKRMANKELDTTEIADYVVNSLKRIGKKLTSNKLEDLCNVIGEILINAEEHSTTKHRFSCGYFKEEKIGDKHFGLFRLVILNFGETIYEKFKSDECPNRDMVLRMRELSKSYTRKILFLPGKFEEETLWTLYALQEGVTSVSTECYKRGNGSIRFIESFFNIKGTQDEDKISHMTIVSGYTKIVFDGTYCITEGKSSDGTTHKMMTFNKSGNIEEAPDNRYVMHTKNYFPGTMICAELLLNDDDIKQI